MMMRLGRFRKGGGGNHSFGCVIGRPARYRKPSAFFFVFLFVCHVIEGGREVTAGLAPGTEARTRA